MYNNHHILKVGDVEFKIPLNLSNVLDSVNPDGESGNVVILQEKIYNDDIISFFNSHEDVNFCINDFFSKLPLDKVYCFVEFGMYLDITNILISLSIYIIKEYIRDKEITCFKFPMFDFMYNYITEKLDLNEIETLMNINKLYNPYEFGMILENIYNIDFLITDFVTHLTFGYKYNQVTENLPK